MRYVSCVLPARTQLGHVERRLLLDASAFDSLGPPYEHAVFPVLVNAPGRDGQEATRRAVQQLVSKGLIELLGEKRFAQPKGGGFGGKDAYDWLIEKDARLAKDPRTRFTTMREATGSRPRPEYKRKVTFRLMRRTEMGDRVVREYRRELEGGLPIRWR